MKRMMECLRVYRLRLGNPMYKFIVNLRNLAPHHGKLLSLAGLWFKTKVSYCCCDKTWNPLYIIQCNDWCWANTSGQFFHLGSAIPFTTYERPLQLRISSKAAASFLHHYGMLAALRPLVHA